MKCIYLALLISILAGCTVHHHLHIHSGAMDEEFSSEHVNYQGGQLTIDDEVINLPPGDKLSIRYSARNGESKYVVKVDGDVVASEGDGS